MIETLTVFLAEIIMKIGYFNKNIFIDILSVEMNFVVYNGQVVCMLSSIALSKFSIINITNLLIASTIFVCRKFVFKKLVFPSRDIVRVNKV